MLAASAILDNMRDVVDLIEVHKGGHCECTMYQARCANVAIIENTS